MNQSTNESKKKLDNAFRGSLANFFQRSDELSATHPFKMQTAVTVVKLTTT